MDSEGMTISNPGGFVEGITYENLLTLPPHGRNPLLAEALKRVGLAEKTGRGVDRIYEGSLRFGRPLPDYSASTVNDVVLFTPRAPFDAAFTTMIFDEERQSGRPFTVFALMVLSVIRDERKVNFGALREATHIDQGRLHRVLGELVERGLIESHGTGRATTYLLSARVYRETGHALQVRVDDVRHPELVMELARVQGSLMRSDVAELLRVSPSKAGSIIKEMTASGSCDLRGMGYYLPTLMGTSRICNLNEWKPSCISCVTNAVRLIVYARPFKRKERLMREISGLAKFGYFCVGLFGGLFGVLAAWFMGKDGWGWSEGGKLFAWFGCLFWLIVWVVMVVTGGIAAFLGMLLF